MNLYGVGVDLVEIARIAQAVARHGDGFAARILCAAEMEAYRAHRQKAAFLAKRFAAKEAVVKALGVGIGAQLGLRDINITHEAAGRPLVEFNARGRDLCERLGVGRVHVSISDERRYANAFAVAERGAI